VPIPTPISFTRRGGGDGAGRRRIIIAAFVIIVIAGMRVASRPRYVHETDRGRITAFFGFQAVVNIGGVIRMLPMTGITLPSSVTAAGRC